MKKQFFKIKWFLYNQINKQNPFIALLLDNLDIFDDITKIIEFCGILLLSAIVGFLIAYIPPIIGNKRMLYLQYCDIYMYENGANDTFSYILYKKGI